MLTQYIRVFKGNEDLTDPDEPVITLEDISMDNAERSAMTFSEKYLYIAQKYPFNNIFFLMGERLNTETSKMKIEYWNDAGEWIEAKDVLDFTKGLKKHGLVQFSLDNDYSWDCIPETDDDDTSVPDELQDLNINDCHWLRVSFDVDPECDIADDPDTVDEDETFNGPVEFKGICYAFTTTEKVNGVDTQASRHYETFQTGKTDWLDEILIGSEMLISDMKTAGLLKHHGQIILLDDFYLPAAWRVLMHIYSQMGVAYEGKRGEVSAAYKNFLKGPKTIDEKMDGKIEKKEMNTSSPRMYR